MRTTTSHSKNIDNLRNRLRVTPDWERVEKHLVRMVIRHGTQIPLVRPAGHGAENGFYLPGGNVHKGGETILNALEREAREELGVEVVPTRYFLHLDYQSSKGHSASLDVVEVTITSGEGRLFDLNKKENDKIKLVTEAKIRKVRVEWKSLLALNEYWRLPQQ